VLLPVALGSERQPAESRPLAPGLRPVVPLHRRVLLVEDEPAVLDLIRRHFELYGFAVVTAANGRQALPPCSTRPGRSTSRCATW
jgi:hypothetical protein